jgi:hypothetical protein
MRLTLIVSAAILRSILVTAGALLAIASLGAAPVTCNDNVSVAFAFLQVIVAETSQLVIRNKTLYLGAKLVWNTAFHHHFRQIIPELGEHVTVLVIETLHDGGVHIFKIACI